MRYLIAVAIMAALLAGWIAVQALARRFARRHPELGECREEGGGCCGSCAGAGCARKDTLEHR